MINALLLKMTELYAGDPACIQHFFKVHAFSRLIGMNEGLDAEALFTLEAAAAVHDIGIKYCRETYGSCNGKLQEKEGPAIAEKMLKELGFKDSVIQRVCYLVAHHHTYDNIDGTDYRILVEADFLVNLHEGSAAKEKAESVLKTIFKTQTGTKLLKDMFAL